MSSSAKTASRQPGSIGSRGRGGSTSGLPARPWRRPRPASRIRLARLPGGALLLRNERRGRLSYVTVAATELLAQLTEIRATDPAAIPKALAKRKRRALLQNSSLFL